MVIVGYPYPETRDDDRATPREMVARSRAPNKRLSAFAGDQRSASRHADSRAVRPRCLAEQPNERRVDLDRFNIESGSDAQRLTRRQADQDFPALRRNRAMTSAAFVVWAASDRTIAPPISSCPSPRKRVIAMPPGRRKMRKERDFGGCRVFRGTPFSVVPWSPQAVLAIQWLWSLSMLWVAATNRNSDCTAALPLRMN